MSDYLTYPSSMPEPEQWNGSQAHNDPGAGSQAHRCLDCEWFGHGPGAYRHHAENHHRIELTYAPALGVVSFSCCSGSAARKVV